MTEMTEAVHRILSMAKDIQQAADDAGLGSKPSGLEEELREAEARAEALRKKLRKEKPVTMDSLDERLRLVESVVSIMKRAGYSGIEVKVEEKA